MVAITLLFQAQTTTGSPRLAQRFEAKEEAYFLGPSTYRATLLCAVFGLFARLHRRRAVTGPLMKFERAEQVVAMLGEQVQGQVYDASHVWKAPMGVLRDFETLVNAAKTSIGESLEATAEKRPKTVHGKTVHVQAGLLHDALASERLAQERRTLRPVGPAPARRAA